MNVLIFNLNLYGEWPCGLVNKYLAKVYTLYGIVPPTPHVVAGQQVNSVQSSLSHTHTTPSNRPSDLDHYDPNYCGRHEGRQVLNFSMRFCIREGIPPAREQYHWTPTDL